MEDVEQNIPEFPNQTDSVEGILKGLEDVKENRIKTLKEFEKGLNKIVTPFQKSHKKSKQHLPI